MLGIILGFYSRNSCYHLWIPIVITIEHLPVGSFFFGSPLQIRLGVYEPKFGVSPLVTAKTPKIFAPAAHMQCFSLVIPRLPAGSEGPFRIEPKNNLPVVLIRLHKRVAWNQKG